MGRHVRDKTAARIATWLLAVLLVLPLAHPGHATAPTSDAKATALARLGAAIGQRITLCARDAPSRPDGPAHGGGCEHCVLCHVAGIWVTPAPGETIVARLARHVAVERPRDGADRPLARRRGATSRGPPSVG